MKMNYLLKSNRGKVKKWKRITLPLIVLVTVFVVRIFAPQFLSSTFFSVAQSFWNVRNTLTNQVDNILTYFSSKTSLSSQIGSLQEKLVRVRELAIQNRILREENASLRVLVGRGIQDEWILAGVIEKPPRTPFDIILIDAGKRDGVENGMMIVSGKIFLGEIIEALDDVSKVELFSIGGGTLEGVILRTNTSVTITGRGGGNFEAEVPRSFNIEVGDTVSLSGLETLLIAEVLSVESDSTAAFKTVLLRSPITLTSLRFVEIRKYR